MGVKSYLIGGPSEVTDEILAGASVIGVTSGASAPEEQVQMVLDELKRRGASDVEEVTVRDEDVAFVLPRELVSMKRQLRMAASV